MSKALCRSVRIAILTTKSNATASMVILYGIPQLPVWQTPCVVVSGTKITSVMSTVTGIKPLMQQRARVLKVTLTGFSTAVNSRSKLWCTTLKTRLMPDLRNSVWVRRSLMLRFQKKISLTLTTTWVYRRTRMLYCQLVLLRLCRLTEWKCSVVMLKTLQPLKMLY